jgi:peptidyl-prolyl cis-trans isomerase A (cyclophilin A)
MQRLACLLLLVAACSTDPPTAKTERPASAPAAKPEAPAPAKPTSDPEEGDFTLDEATAGLPAGKTLKAIVTVPQGQITCELFADKAPLTVASFVGLARGVRAFFDPETGFWEKRPFFDGLAFHRVIPMFMIQGGDPRSVEYNHPHVGTGNPGYRLPDEIVPGLKFDRPGRLAMANAGPGTGGSQFYITEAKSADLDGSYTIFGQCKEVAVVKAVARVPRDGKDKPNEPVRMKVEIRRE